MTTPYFEPFHLNENSTQCQETNDGYPVSKKEVFRESVSAVSIKFVAFRPSSLRWAPWSKRLDCDQRMKYWGLLLRAYLKISKRMDNE